MNILTDKIKESLAIEKFIYHVIRHDGNEPSFNDEITLQQEQKEFFERQICSAFEGTQFIFIDSDNNNCRNDCLSILEDTSELVPKSQLLTQRFFEAHNRTMSDGIFIVAIVSILIDENRHMLLTFLKIDFTTVYQQKVSEVDGRQIVSLTRIIDSLADTPKALQKWAILDPSEEFSWDVIALQRGKNNKYRDTNEAIPGYFRNFLNVEAKDTASSLTKKTVSQTADWGRDIALNLPPHVKHTDIKARSISYFDTVTNFETDGYIEHVLGTFIPSALKEDNLDEVQQHQKDLLLETQEACKGMLLDRLTEADISGQVFECRPNSIASSERKSKLITNEDVTISFKGELTENNIVIESTDNESIIKIRTINYSIL